MSAIFECKSCGSKLTGRSQQALKCPRCGNLARRPAADELPARKVSRNRITKHVAGPRRFVAENTVGVVSAALILLAGLLIVLASQAGGDPDQTTIANTDADLLATTNDVPRRDDDESNLIGTNNLAGSPVDSPVNDKRPTRSTKQPVETSLLPSTRTKPRNAPSEPVLTNKPTPPGTTADREGLSKNSDVVKWPELERVTNGARWPHPQLSDASFMRWSEFIRPTEKELAWRKVRWHTELAVAAKEARELQRPILLWTMNGHPCGET